jgi:hypothetical protein
MVRSCLWGMMRAWRNYPTAFEEQLKKLGLNEQTCVDSVELRQWCERNKDRCYIPELLLARWRIAVDANSD